MNGNKFAAFSRNEYSQFGEDGIIEKLLSIIPQRDQWCVEFGAWDGLHLSNTFNLVKNSGYRPVLIEADGEKFAELEKNMGSFNPVLVNAFVTFDGDSTLDNILRKTGIPIDFDFLSIDIDGNDYWILESIKVYRPKIICIEYNPSIPNAVDYVQQRDFSMKRGASALALCKLAKEKSYELVATTSCNLLFVNREYFDLFEIADNRLSELRDDAHCINYTFVGYDGTVIHSTPIRFYWHDIVVDQEKLQVLPGFLRVFPSDLGILKKSLLFAFLFMLQPASTSHRIKAWWRRRSGSGPGLSR